MSEPTQKVITLALAGQPNVGKSTVFNMLTGLNQHVGNWPGKTVEQKIGEFTFAGKTIRLVDLPGTYSLTANSEEERIARDFILRERPDVIVVIANATALERSLYSRRPAGNGWRRASVSCWLCLWAPESWPTSFSHGCDAHLIAGLDRVCGRPAVRVFLFKVSGRFTHFAGVLLLHSAMTTLLVPMQGATVFQESTASINSYFIYYQHVMAE
jgi:energy-coupling factor transporter ATP-binding protein EcfA2